MTDVVILCGGRGSRLGSLTEKVPKPLLPVAGRPFLWHVLMRMRSQGVSRVLLAAGYLAERFQAFARDARDLIPELDVVKESEPLGTGGALRAAAECVRSKAFVALNGDSWMDQPLAPVLASHERDQSEWTIVAVSASRVEGGALKKGVWRVGAGGEPLGFATQEVASDGWVNAGMYCLSRAQVLSWPSGAYSLEEHLGAFTRRCRARIFCSNGHLLDIGTPECYERARRLVGRVESLVAA